MPYIEENKIEMPRLFEFDCLRLLAILAVIMIHVSARLVIVNPQDSISFMIGNFFDSLSRFAVPFFVMISGYFILDENHELPILKLKNKIIKLVLLYIFWSYLYASIYYPHNFIHKFIYGDYHLWYLYLVIGLYLLVPVLRLFLNGKNKNFVYYLILLGVIFLFLPNTLNAIFPPDKASRLFDLFGICNGGYFVYFLLGWVFKNLNDKILRYIKLFTLISILSLLSIFCLTQFIHSKYYLAYEIFYDSIGLPVLLYSVSLFAVFYNTIKKYLTNIPSKIKLFISKCAKLSLGVYLIHVIFLRLYQSIFKNIPYNMVYILIMFCLTVISSFLAVYLISKIKYLNKLINI